MKKDKSIGKRYIKVGEAIFNRTVHVLLNHSDAEYRGWLKKCFNMDDPPEMDADKFAGRSFELCFFDKPTEWVILVNRFDWDIKGQGTLIHEIVHTIIKIWKSNNIPYTIDNQEFLAHSVANLYEDIARKIWKLN